MVQLNLLKRLSQWKVVFFEILSSAWLPICIVATTVIIVLLTLILILNGGWEYVHQVRLSQGQRVLGVAIFTLSIVIGLLLLEGTKIKDWLVLFWFFNCLAISFTLGTMTAKHNPTHGLLAGLTFCSVSGSGFCLAALKGLKG